MSAEGFDVIVCMHVHVCTDISNSSRQELRPLILGLSLLLVTDMTKSIRYSTEFIFF